MTQIAYPPSATASVVFAPKRCTIAARGDRERHDAEREGRGEPAHRELRNAVRIEVHREHRDRGAVRDPEQDDGRVDDPDVAVRDAPEHAARYSEKSFVR